MKKKKVWYQCPSCGYKQDERPEALECPNCVTGYLVRRSARLK